LRDNLKIIYLH